MKIMGTADGDTYGDRALKSLFQALLLLLLGVLLGSASNALRNDGLPWVGEFKQPAAEGSVLTTTVREAWKGYQQGRVQFVDARSPSEYAGGHLPGALSMPVEEVEGSASPTKLPEGREIVIYCSDPSCPKSARLASLLAKKGVKGIRIMPEGWAGWYEAGLPYEGNGEG